LTPENHGYKTVFSSFERDFGNGRRLEWVTWLRELMSSEETLISVEERTGGEFRNAVQLQKQESPSRRVIQQRLGVTPGFLCVWA